MILRLGTIHSFEDLPDAPLGHQTIYETEIEQIVRSEEVGYDWVNLTEHHATDDGYCPALLPTLAAVATATDRLGLSTGMLILPLHHPVRIAEEAAVVDVISGGRLALGIAAGYRELEFDVFGIDYSTRGRRMAESIEIIRHAWTGEPFSYEGRIFELPEITVRPTPVQRPHPPLWLGGLSDPALRRAVRNGSPFFPGATQTATEVADGFARFCSFSDRLEASAPREIVLPRLAYIADTTEEARTVALPAIAALFERYVIYGNPPEVQDALSDWALLDEYAIVGDEERCAEQVARYAELGVTDLMLQFALPSLDPKRALEATERFPTAVAAAMPSESR